jgi:hypothetical protein
MITSSNGISIAIFIIQILVHSILSIKYSEYERNIKYNSEYKSNLI